MKAIQLSEALTFWTAPHPAWKPNPAWPEDVGFATWLAPNSFVLIDPLVRDDLDASAWQQFDRAVFVSGRPAAVLLTAPWHAQSARAVAARYGAGVWIHPQGRGRIAELPELTALPAGIETFVPGGMGEGQVVSHRSRTVALCCRVLPRSQRGAASRPVSGNRRHGCVRCLPRSAEADGDRSCSRCARPATRASTRLSRPFTHNTLSSA